MAHGTWQMALGTWHRHLAPGRDHRGRVDPDTRYPRGLDFGVLRRNPLELRDSYASAQPFPHIVIDGLFDDAILDTVLEDFPAPGAMRWARFDNPNEKKLGFYYETSAISRRLRLFLDSLNRFEMLLFLEQLTGIEGLIPDPYFGGGGLHQIESGGFLKMHVDFNRHPKLHLDRRLNMLIYLNRNWAPSYGGELELWDVRTRECVRAIAPLFNRTVVFSTSESSLHGHPRPLTTPPDVTRRSVSLYYYTAGRPDPAPPHDTIFFS